VGFWWSSMKLTVCRWSPPSKKTARYALGELLRDSSDNLLLLTATPHKGDPANFSLFLQLLDEGRLRRREVHTRKRWIANEPRFTSAGRRRRWSTSRSASLTAHGEAKKIFTKRIPHTVDFHIDGAEDELYRESLRS